MRRNSHFTAAMAGFAAAAVLLVAGGLLLWVLPTCTTP